MNKRNCILCSLKQFYLGKAAAGFDYSHHKEQHQQSAADGLERSVDVLNDSPDPAVLEVFRGGADELPDQPQLGVPGFQRRVQVVYDPISASYLYHLFSL